MQEAPNGTPSSRVVKASFGDIDEFAQAVRDWDLDYRQLDGGHLEADLQQVSSKNVTITDVHFTRQLLQMGGCPVGVRTFGLLAEGVSELRWCGKRPLDTDILVFPRTDYESVSLLGFRASTLSFPEAHLVGIAETLGLQGVIDSADVAPGKAVACDVRLVAELRGRLNRLSRTLGARPEAAESSAVLYELDFEVPALLLSASASAESARFGAGPRPSVTSGQTRGGHTTGDGVPRGAPP
jgi:hypothetical protein